MKTLRDIFAVVLAVLGFILIFSEPTSDKDFTLALMFGKTFVGIVCWVVAGGLMQIK